MFMMTSPIMKCLLPYSWKGLLQYAPTQTANFWPAAYSSILVFCLNHLQYFF
jgi:hypothetical protein